MGFKLLSMLRVWVSTKKQDPNKWMKQLVSIGDLLVPHCRFSLLIPEALLSPILWYGILLLSAAHLEYVRKENIDTAVYHSALVSAAILRKDIKETLQPVAVSNKKAVIWYEGTSLSKYVLYCWYVFNGYFHCVHRGFVGLLHVVGQCKPVPLGF